MNEEHISNTTIKLPQPLKVRVARAMKALGVSVFSDFARAALTEKCRKVEAELQRDSPAEYERIYGKD